jgi:hypothetical protein
MKLLFDQCFGWELVVLQITLSMLGEFFNISIGVGVEVTIYIGSLRAKLILATDKSELVIKPLRAPFLVFSKVFYEIHFDMTFLLAKVKRLPFISIKLGVPTQLECSTNIIKCQKWAKTPLSNHAFSEFSRPTLLKKAAMVVSMQLQAFVMTFMSVCMFHPRLGHSLILLQIFLFNIS